MARPGMTDYDGEPVARLEGPLLGGRPARLEGPT